MASAIAALFLAPGMAAAACTGDNPIATALSVTQCYLDVDVTINNGASVTVVGGDAVLFSVADYSHSLVNNGVLSGKTISGEVQSANGTITAYSSSVNNAGVLIDGSLSGSLTNSSTGAIAAQFDVSAMATSDDSTYAYAYAYAGQGDRSRAGGVWVGNVDGSISNDGRISAVATSNAEASGTVSRVANDTTDYAYALAYSGDVLAEGVLIGGDLNGGFVNNSTGTISALTTSHATTTASIGNDIYTGGEGYVWSANRSYAAAFGVAVDGGMGVDSSFNNHGSITADSSSTSISTATASSVFDHAQAFSIADAYAVSYGLQVGGQVGSGASINNYGTISASSVSSSSASASGTAIDMAAAGLSLAYADAYGVGLSGGVNGGSLTNRKSISAAAKGDAVASAIGNGADVRTYSYGIGVASGLSINDFYNGTQWISLDGIVTNEGAITASATGSSETTANSTSTYDYAYAYANGGGAASAEAYGIYLSSYFATDASLVNNGTISAVANATSGVGIATANASGDDAYAYAYAGGRSRADAEGITERRGLLAGALIANNGSISAIANSNPSAVATASASSSLSHAYAYAETHAYATAYGIVVGNHGLAEGASINNHGSISAIANASGSATAGATGPNVVADAYAYAYAYASGVHIQGGLAVGATFINTGSISAVATSNPLATAANDTGRQAYARAYGMAINDELAAGSMVTNSGTISAIANGTDAQAYGVFINNSLNGSLVNSGTISGATSNDPTLGYSLYISDGTGTVNNQLGGLLQGNLYVGGTVAVTNAGTIALPQGVEAQIAGDYHQTAAGTLRIAADTTISGGYSKLTVGGTATLDTGAKIYVDVKNSGHNLTTGGTLSGVISADTLTWDDTASVKDNSLGYNFSAMRNGQNLDLLAAYTGITSAADAVAKLSPVAIGAASVFDTLLVNGTNDADMQTILDKLTASDSETEVSNAVSQTLPLLAGGMSQVISGALHDVNRIIQSRQEIQHGRSSGNEFYGDKHFWLTPFGSKANQGDRNSVSGYDANTWGIMFGADAEISGANRIGAAFAYSRSNVDGNSSLARQNADVDNYQLVVYDSHSLSDTTDVNFQADIGKQSNRGNRTISFVVPSRIAHADYDSWSAHIGASLAHTLRLNEKTNFTPSVRADYTTIHEDSFTETGAGALNLHVNSSTTDELILGVDGKLAHEISDKTMLIANLGVGYDLLNKQADITSTFAGAPTAIFTTKGLDPSPWLARGGLGVVAKLNQTTEITARYDIEAREGFNNQTASVKARWAF